MPTPWFFATTPAPTRPAALPARTPSLLARLARRYLAWAERSNRALAGRPHL